ncbi:isoaspartyl peptidase/L-asparaginase [Candidatus Bathyarchaeota archaeon]|nr:isoaspartyl peptidase/L-asparaginase [Candidatus Bathyarchaeota archaeon]
MKGQKPVIVVHGGAGSWREENSETALKWVGDAAKTGFNVMLNGGSAVDAVVEAVAVMEDSGVFNAGCGSTLNIEGFVEMEASVMDGWTLKAGAAALLRNVRNPVKLARAIMENTDHVLVAGEGAEKLARLFRIEQGISISERQLKRYEEYKKKLLEGKFELQKIVDLVKNHREFFNLGTVGAVALDVDGNVAAATSTGGFPLKLPGRIGDSSIIGCGTYADNRSGACSATGLGEVAIRLALASTVCHSMKLGLGAQEAAEMAVRLVNERIAEPYHPIGLITVNVKGEIGAAHNSPGLCWAYLKPSMEKPIVKLKAKTIN